MAVAWGEGDYTEGGGGETKDSGGHKKREDHKHHKLSKRGEERIIHLFISHRVIYFECARSAISRLPAYFTHPHDFEIWTFRPSALIGHQPS